MSRLASAACVLFLAGLGLAQPPADLPPPAPRLGAEMAPPAAASGPGHSGEILGAASHGEASGKDCCGAFLFDGEIMAWAARRRASQDYALVGNNPNVGPIGDIRTVDGAYDPGLRVAAGYRFCPDGLDVMARYTYWHGQREDAASANGPGTAVFTTLTHPSTVSAVLRGQGNDSTNLNLFDFEVGHRFSHGERLKGRGFVGIRYANVDQDFAAAYAGGQVAYSLVTRQSTFDGAGLRLGGEATYELVQGLGLLVRGSTGMMAGRFRTNLSELSNDTLVMNATERFNKVVPMADLGIGVTFTWGIMKLTAGYEFVNFFGMVDTFDFVDDIHPAKMTRRTGDLGLDGIFGRCELTF